MENDQVKRLYRSKSDRWIAGVCGGIAQYLGIDSLIIRIIMILLILLGGSGFIFYIVAWILIPVNPNQLVNKSKTDNSKVLGTILLILGLFLLLKNLGYIPLFEFFKWWEFISWSIILSVILILIGILLIIYQTKASTPPIEKELKENVVITEQAELKPKKKILRKSRKDKKISGVCAGIGEYLEIDVTIVRLIFVLITLSSLGLGLLLYVILAIIMPNERGNFYE